MKHVIQVFENIIQSNQPSLYMDWNNLDTWDIIILVNICRKNEIKMILFVCVFLWGNLKKNEFVIIAIYDDNINIIGTPGKLPKVVNYLNK